MPDIFIFLMQYFRNKLTPQEMYDLVKELEQMIGCYHGELEDIVSAFVFDKDAFKKMTLAKKQLILKIKNRLDMIDELQC